MKVYTSCLARFLGARLLGGSFLGARLLGTWFLAACIFNCYAEDVVKWVDKDGKIHFGSSVPAEYADQAEKVDLQEVNTAVPEPNVKAHNRRYSEQLKSRDATQRYKAKQETAERRRQAAQQQSQSTNYTPSRIECRDIHGPNRIKDRTECFKNAETQ